MSDWNEKKLFELLKSNYPEEGYAVMSQVRNATGYSHAKTRTADAIVMDLWPSRGLSLMGFEIKCTRTDLQNELGNPSKCESIAKYCDFWWLLLSDEKISEGLNIPDSWGVMVPNTRSKKRLKVVKKAKKLEPIEISKGFLASLLRSANQLPNKSLIKESKKQGYDEGLKDGEKRAKSKYDYKRSMELRDYDRLKDIIKEFESVSGIQITSYGFNPKIVGKVVSVLSDFKDPFKFLDNSIENLKEILERMEKVQKENLGNKVI